MEIDEPRAPGIARRFGTSPGKASESATQLTFGVAKSDSTAHFGPFQRKVLSSKDTSEDLEVEEQVRILEQMIRLGLSCFFESLVANSCNAESQAPISCHQINIQMGLVTLKNFLVKLH